MKLRLVCGEGAAIPYQFYTDLGDGCASLQTALDRIDRAVGQLPDGERLLLRSRLDEARQAASLAHQELLDVIKEALGGG